MDDANNPLREDEFASYGTLDEEFRPQGGSLSDTALYPNPHKESQKDKSKRTRRQLHSMRGRNKKLAPPPEREEQRRKRREDRQVDDEDDLFRLTGYGVCKEYDTESLSTFLKAKYFEQPYKGKVIVYTDVLQIKMKEKDQHAFLFPYGVAIFFNMNEQQERQLLKEMHAFEIEPFGREVWSFEDMEYKYGDNNFSVKNDVCTLSTRRSLEKLSIAFALAQCVKLNVFEDRIETVIEENRDIPESLAKTGTIALSRTDMSRKIGELFMERNNINLHFDILDTPEYFWEEDMYMPQYERLYNYLELGQRVRLLNKRLDLLQELFDMLSQQIENLHASKLEWVIIILIAFEVIIEVFWNIGVKDLLGYFPRH